MPIQLKRIEKSKSSSVFSRKGLPNKCAGCSKRIRSRYLVQALGKIWHERCFCCDMCNEILYSFGENKCYFKEDYKLCKIDYMRLFVPGGACSKCNKDIPSTETVLKFKNNLSYHLSCFYCVICHYRFCVGDVVRIPRPNLILCVEHKIEDIDRLESYLKNQITTEHNQDVIGQLDVPVT